MRKYIFSFIFIILYVVSASAQVRFVAEVGATEIPLNQAFEFRFTIEGGGQIEANSFKYPGFNDFHVLQNFRQSNNISWSSNGGMQQSTSFSLVLQPKKQGEFIIQSAEIVVDGKTYKTEPVKLKVGPPTKEQEQKNQYRQQRQQKSPIDEFWEMIREQERRQREEMQRYQQRTQNLGEGIFLVSNVSKSTAYVNEPITVEYRLYVSHYVAIQELQFKDIPKFEGFWNHLIENKELKVQEGTYNGKIYRYVVLQKGVLLPQKDGKLTIDPMTLDLDTRLPTGRYDSFGTPEMRPEKKVYSSGSKTITVKPLPTNGVPESFNGAVGDFTYTVDHSDFENLKTNEPIEIRVTVAGAGNFDLIDLPKIEVPNGLEIYEPEVVDKISNNLSVGMKGSKTYKYVIVPQYKGKYTIAPKPFSYFDLKTQKYKTITPDTLTFEIKQGASLPVNQPEETVEKATETTFKNVFLPLNNSVTADFYKNKNLFSILIFLPIALIPICLLFFFIRRKTAPDESLLLQRQTQRLAKKYLSEAKKKLGDKEVFYEALEKGMHHFLKATLKIETKDMSSEHIMQLLEDAQITPQVITDFMQVKENCEQARYAQFSLSNQEADYQNATKQFVLIQQQIKAKKK